MSKRKGTTPKNNSAKGWKARSQALKRAAAEKRQQVYDKLTTQQKLEQLDKLNLKATKVRVKLTKQLTAAK